MRLTDAQNYSVEPGALMIVGLAARRGGDLCEVGLSENEQFHIRSHRSGHRGSLTLVVDFPYEVDRAVLESLPALLLSRHDVLRTYVAAIDDHYSRMHLPASAIVTTTEPIAAEKLSSEALTELVMDRIEASCNPCEPVSHFFAAVSRSQSTTVICAFDHVYVDARSLTVVATDIADVVDGQMMSPPASGLDAVRAHICADDVADDDPRMVGWLQFFDETGWRVTEFPFDLGVPIGRRAPMRTRVATLLDNAEGQRFSSAVHRHGARTFSALLTCIGIAIRAAGGPPETSMVVPTGLATRDPVVAWVVGNVPLRVRGEGTVEELLAANAIRLAQALPLAKIGLTPVYQAYGDRLQRGRGDVFMVSYVDYTRQRLPSTSVEVQQLSEDHDTDNVQWWLWRGNAGIHVRVRYPATPEAEDVIGRVLAETISAISEVDRLSAGQRTSVGVSSSVVARDLYQSR